jgi:hypothetical protein
MLDIRRFSDAGEHHFLRCPKVDFSSLKKHWNRELEMKKKETRSY